MPRTGRPRRALPRTPTEAAAELRRFGLSPTVLPLGVFLSLNDVVVVLDRLRKRGRAEVDVAQEPTVADSTGAPEPDRRAVLVLDARGLHLEPADAIDSDHDAAADLPWGADDPHPPVPTGDPDEVPVATDPKPYPHRRDDLDGNAHCRCGVMAIHDPVLGETWGSDCPAALREALDAERGRSRRYATHLNDIRCDVLDTGHPLGDDSDPELTPRRLVRETLALFSESRARETHLRLVNDVLMRPVEVAPLSHRDDSDPRVPVRSLLLVMAIKLMAAAVRANPDAKNYGAWMVSANPDAERDPEPGSPEDIGGWDIHVACVRPGGKGPADLVADVKAERDAAIARAAELEATLANERGEGEPPSEGWARNDIDPKREGVAWYVRWEADGSEPQEDDTEQTRVAWVRRTEGCMIEWMWEIEKSVGRMSDPMLTTGRAPTARAAMIAADAARGGR